MSDLFGNHIVGFPTRWLIYIYIYSWNASLFCFVFHAYVTVIEPSEINVFHQTFVSFFKHEKLNVSNDQELIQRELKPHPINPDG